MRALIKARPEFGLELVERPTPTPGPSDVLIRVVRAAICGTDLHIYKWDDWASTNMVPPVIVGHEFVGVVEAVGSQVDFIECGTRVAGEGHITCGRCRNCRAGDGHNCRSTIGVGIHRDGGFADYVVIPAVNAYPIPDSLDDDTAAILDPLGNAVHTALSFDLVGEDVLITGAGPIGQMAAAVCRHAGARHVVITDIEPGRLRTAEAMGASCGVVAGEGRLRAAMSELSMTEGFDIALEMSGSPHALADILEHATHGGKVGLLGLFAQAVEVDLNAAILKGLTIKGIYGREMFDTWYKTVAMLDSGLSVEPIISNRIDLENYEDAFEMLLAGNASKVVLKVS